MSDLDDANNAGDFNNPFVALNKRLKGSRKKSPAAPGSKPAPKADRQRMQPTDVLAADAQDSAIFLAAMGGSVTKSSGADSAPAGQSMAELLAESNKKGHIPNSASFGAASFELSPCVRADASPGTSTNDSSLASSKASAQASSRASAGASADAATRRKQAAPGLDPAACKQALDASGSSRSTNKAMGDPNNNSTAFTDDESTSFATAMQGVRPVGERRGRALVPPAPLAPLRHKSIERDYLSEFTEGKYEFALEYTEEFFEGHVMGLDPLAVAKLRTGSYSPEAHIDLHGLNAEQAYAALLDFIRASYKQDHRVLIVVTGRGKNSPGGLGVLRRSMQDWLTRDPFRRVVLAFCTAQPKDGGAGAMYVMLRKFKKKQGKIRWECGHGEDGPLL